MKNLSLALIVSSAFLTVHTNAQENKLEEIIVTASRVETPLREVGASVSVINFEEIQLRGYPTVAELLRTQPGISMTNTGGLGKPTSVSIRGEDGFRTLMLIDGIEMSDPTNTQVGAQMEQQVAGGEIERVEVLRGPQGFIYGADAGGVINIITRSPSEGLASGLSGETGSFNSKKFTGYTAYGSELGDVFFSVAPQSTDGFNARPVDASGESDGYENTTLHGKAGLNFSRGWRAQLVVRDITGENEYDGYTGDPNYLGYFDQTAAKISVNQTRETYGHHIGLMYSEVDRRDVGEYPFAAAGTIEKVEYLTHWDVASWLTLLGGGDVEQEAVDNDAGDLERDQHGVFGEMQGGVLDQLFYTVGLRYDDSDEFGEHLSGRVSAAYLISVFTADTLKFRASSGNGFRAPSLNELTYKRPPGDFAPLTEETSRGYDVGVEYLRDDGFNAQVTYFDQEIEDQIKYQGTADRYAQIHGRSRSKGWELTTQIPIDDILRLDGNFTKIETETADNKQRGRKPGRTANLSVYIFPADRFKILVSGSWVADVVNSDGGTPLPNYYVFDTSVSYALNEHVELFVRAQNISDEEYVMASGYNSAGRAGYLGGRISF